MPKKISLIDALVALKANLDKLSGRDFEFAESLIRQSDHRPLSEKQTPHVFRLHDKALGIVPVIETVAVNATGIEALLRAAGSRLKYPAIKLRTQDGTFLRVSIAGERSANPGAINIAGEGSYQGRGIRSPPQRIEGHRHRHRRGASGLRG